MPTFQHGYTYERHGGVARIYASYSRGRGFECQPGDLIKCIFYVFPQLLQADIGIVP